MEQSSNESTTEPTPTAPAEGLSNVTKLEVKPKELTAKEKAHQAVIDKSIGEFQDLKNAITNLVNIHNLLNQGEFKGAQHANLALAESWIKAMYDPLRADLDKHPMFVAEQEEMKKRDAEMRSQQMKRMVDEVNASKGVDQPTVEQTVQMAKDMAELAAKQAGAPVA